MYALSFCAAFNLITNLIVIPRYSYIGTAATSAVTEFLVVAITFFLIARNLSYKPKIKGLCKTLIAGLIMALFLYFFKNQNLFILLAGSAIIYFFTLWIMRAITTEEIKSIIKRN